MSRGPARHRREEAEPDHRDRWLVSYADLITLMFAFFVVMFVISTRNEDRYKMLASALMQAFKGEQTVGPPPLPGQAPQGVDESAPSYPTTPALDPQSEGQMMDLARTVRDALEPMVASGQVHFRQLPDGLAIEISASLLFAPAEATLSPETVAALQSVARVLATSKREIRVEGHTDNVQISSALYPSNWELSSARATSVVRLLVASGVGPDRISAVGYGEHRPVAPNDTVEGRARNRRVTLMVVDGAGASGRRSAGSSIDPR